ncbi:unnamed protein product [Clonostachys rosea f. rosea IK726]|uniref:Zn(2)-C6 fungal-type domain-containing protein n=2 Tax=Bionectria ochroleuca TaxID=29856 RepID=A0A0B7KA61_BIOOC|nr:unnamed protein product [Clonostachys rosea f. rosea IK726]
MTKRKKYRKVRGGCLTCKERKVRCGLEKPECENCTRLDRPCAYAEAPVRPSAMQEVELMHHYTAYTCLSMSENPVLRSLWREIVPKHAFRHPFLLQGLFACAALHKVHGDHDMEPAALARLIHAADFYQQNSLKTYIDLLSDVTEENCHALFAFSQIIAGLSFARLSSNIHEHTGGPIASIDSFLSLSELMKGTLNVAIEGIEWLREGDLRSMLGDAPSIPSQQELAGSSTPCARAMKTLSHQIAGQIQDDEASRARVEVLQSTLRLVYGLFLEPPESKERLNNIGGFLVFADLDFIRLLKEWDHAALVILAYYGAALHRLRHIWYYGDVGAKIVKAVKDIDMQAYFTHLSWPQQQVGI